MSEDVDESTESKIEIDLSNDATFPQDAIGLTVLFKASQRKIEKQTEAFQKKLIASDLYTTNAQDYRNIKFNNL